MSRIAPAWSPPMHDGVSASRVAVSAGPWVTVAEFLAARLPAAQDWPARLARGEVLDAQGHPVSAEARCQPGAVLWYWRSPPPEAPVPFEVEILFQDEHLVVVDKPHFLSVLPRGRHLHETVLVRVKKALGISTLVPMHRLDRETAGVVVLLVQPRARDAYQSLLRQARVHKEYEAVAPWHPDWTQPGVLSTRLEPQSGDRFMQMCTVPGAPNAHTHIEMLRRLESGALGLAHYRLRPITGRKHQLRAQLCSLGIPIVGDRIYPVLWPETPPGQAEDFTRPLQLLARELAFTDPLNGQWRCFRSRRTLALVAPSS